MNQIIINRAAEKTGHSKDLVDVVQRSMWTFVRDTMESGKLETIMVPYFCKFIVKKMTRELIDEKGSKIKQSKRNKKKEETNGSIENNGNVNNSPVDGVRNEEL